MSADNEAARMANNMGSLARAEDQEPTDAEAAVGLSNRLQQQRSK